MWLTSSSIGRKLVMSITGAALILFVTFHVLMNAVALISPAAYNVVCAFLGANWYALVASIGLAVLFIIHIVYACWLTIQNRRARGNDRYAVTSRPPQVEWSSKNMLVLGIVVLAFLVVHLIQFWAKMQWAEITHVPATFDCAPVPPQAGTMFIQMAFSQWWTLVVYAIGFIALWFHMTHGFWSMFQTAGWSNDKWIPRLKTIGCWWATIVCGLFLAQAIVFTVQAHNNAYITCPELQEQYAEFTQELPCCAAEVAECPDAAAVCPEGAAVCPEGKTCPEGAAVCPEGKTCPEGAVCPEGKTCPEGEPCAHEAQKK